MKKKKRKIKRKSFEHRDKSLDSSKLRELKDILDNANKAPIVLTTYAYSGGQCAYGSNGEAVVAKTKKEITEKIVQIFWFEEGRNERCTSHYHQL
jgi:hypothetical protein